MKASEYEEMMREEEALEIMREREEEKYTEWKEANIKTLKEDFIDENKKLFQEFLSEVIISEEYDLDYWKEAFLEPYEDDFYYFCKDRYGEK